MGCLWCLYYRGSQISNMKQRNAGCLDIVSVKNHKVATSVSTYKESTADLSDCSLCYSHYFVRM